LFLQSAGEFIAVPGQCQTGWTFVLNKIEKYTKKQGKNVDRIVSFLHRHLPWIIMLVLITLQSALSSAMLGALPRGMDKVIHFLIFGVTGWLGARAVFYNGKGASSAQWVLLLIAGALFAAFDEWHQSLVPGRYPDFWDWCADMAGILTFGMLYFRTLISKEYQSP